MSEAKEAKHLRDENSRVKRSVADLRMDKGMLQSVIQKLPSLVERRSEVRRLLNGLNNLTATGIKDELHGYVPLAQTEALRLPEY